MEVGRLSEDMSEDGSFDGRPEGKSDEEAWRRSDMSKSAQMWKKGEDVLLHQEDGITKLSAAVKEVKDVLRS